MKKIVLVAIVVCTLLLLNACARQPRPFEVGRVTLIANGIEHKPHMHLLHDRSIQPDGTLSPPAQGIPLSWWLEENLSTLSEIPYAANMQISIDGSDGEIGLYWSDPEPLDGVSLIAIHPSYFSDGKAHISLPDEPGIYLVFIDVNWSNREENPEYAAYTINRYLFKVVR